MAMFAFGAIRVKSFQVGSVAIATIEGVIIVRHDTERGRRIIWTEL
jgi:hypothetical protein